MIQVKNPLIRAILQSLHSYDPPIPAIWFPDTGPHSFSIRVLDLEKDLPLVYEWVNLPYAIPFWQMQGTYQSLLDTYRFVRLSSFSESLVGCMDGKPVCQLDLYDPASDVIRRYYSPEAGDIGFHLLMAPGKKQISNCTARIVSLFLRLFFQFPSVRRVIGEPDARNEKANRLLAVLGFRFHGPLALPHKQAHFYTLTRQQYQQITQTLSL